MLTPAVVKPNGLKTILLLKSLYFTVTVVVIPGVTLIWTLSPRLSPWVEAVATVTLFLETSAFTTFSLTVFRLWLDPVPIPVKNNNPEFIVVSATPTKVPVDPIPTLKVWIPITLSLILATYNWVSFAIL